MNSCNHVLNNYYINYGINNKDSLELFGYYQHFESPHKHISIWECVHCGVLGRDSHVDDSSIVWIERTNVRIKPFGY